MNAEPIIKLSRIKHNGIEYELISGPWRIEEKEIMDAHIKGMQKGGIKCAVKHEPEGVFVYRDAKGFKKI